MMKHLATFLILLCVVAHEGQAVEYVAEGYFVVDNTAVQRYVREVSGTTSSSTSRSKALASMNQDIDYFLTEINQLLATLRSGGLNIQIKKRRVEFLTSDVLTRGRRGTTGMSDEHILEDFEAWLNRGDSYDTLNFDFAILWTGYDLYGDLGYKSTGRSYSGTICQGSRASGVIEFTGEYSTVIQTTRAIVVLLGGSQSGPAVKDIMSNNLRPNDGSRWELSTNTARDIDAAISGTSSTCLSLTSIFSSTPTSSLSSYTGSIFDPDVSCQRGQNDQRSYMCKHPYIYDNSSASGDVICRFISCWIPDTINCISTYTPEGLVCNPNRMCDEGSCVYAPSSRTRNVKAGCVHGDQKRVFTGDNFDGTCLQFIARFGKLNCYNRNFTNICCDACEDVCTGPADCKCGDHAHDCADYTRESLCPLYGDICCDYCRGFRGKRSIFGTVSNASLVLKLDEHFEQVEYHLVHETTAYHLVHKTNVRGGE